MFDCSSLSRDMPTHMYALTSTNIGSLNLIISAHCSGSTIFNPFINVNLKTVLDFLRISGSMLNVFISPLHAFLIMGLSIILNNSSFGASTEIYNCVGGSPINFSILSGKSPLLTTNVEKFFFLYSLINSGRWGYKVGSPSREIATCCGFIALSNFSSLVFSFPPKPERSFLCASIEPSTMSFGSSIPPSIAGCVWYLKSLQQNTHALLHTKVGVICTHWLELIP